MGDSCKLMMVGWCPQVIFIFQEFGIFFPPSADHLISPTVYTDWNMTFCHVHTGGKS